MLKSWLSVGCRSLFCFRFPQLLQDFSKQRGVHLEFAPALQQLLDQLHIPSFGGIPKWVATFHDVNSFRCQLGSLAACEPCPAFG